MGIAALARITSLFVEGKELVLRDEGEVPDAVVVWVNKLNAFEMEEARKDGAVAKARLALALKEIGSPEYDLYSASVLDLTRDELTEALLEVSAPRRQAVAANSVRVDPDWAERYHIIQSSVDTAEMQDVERSLLSRVYADYLGEVESRMAVLLEREREEFRDLSEQALRDKHRDAWLDSYAMGAFAREMRKTQVYYALRICKATGRVEGKWDHAACDHLQRACDERDEVLRIPDDLMDGVLSVLMNLSATPDDARFSAGAAKSSELSQRPSEPEDSTASGQEERSPELVTTSS